MTRRLLATLLLLAVLGAGLGWTIGLRTDLAEFLPPGRTPASEFLLRELRGGAATTLLLAGIEGAEPGELARLSRETAAGLRASGRFDLVADGTTALPEAEQALLFRYRYLLSPETRPDAFTPPALRTQLEALLDGLRSSAAPLLAGFGFADPTGAFLGLARAWLDQAAQVETRDGAWFARPVEGSAAAPPRALLLARIGGADGLDAEAQGEAVAAFRAAFEAAGPPPGARLLLSGPALFAAEAAAAIRADVQMVTLASGALLAGFLWWRFRSPLLLALAAVPLGTGIVAGYAACALVSGGAVHGIALGFGMTMLGVTVDYPILLLTLRRKGETLAAAAARIWPTLRLAALSAALGLAAMLGSGFPGLVQLGVFAGAGVLAAAAATRWLLPALMVSETRLVARPLPGRLRAAVDALRGRPRLAMGALLVAAAILVATGGPAWQRDLAALSPVPQAAQALDAELRAQLGAPDVRIVFALGPAATDEEVLQAAERLGAALAPVLGPGGALEGLDLPSDYLPSRERQLARAEALPAAETLRGSLRTAGEGLPFRAGAFAPFLAAIEESRALPPLTRDALAAQAPTLDARLSPLLSQRDEGEFLGIALARGVTDASAIADAVARLGDPRILLIDVKAEMEGILDDYMQVTLTWALAGGALVLLLLVAGLGSPRRAVTMAVPILGALLATLAALAALQEHPTLFHLAALLLLAGLAMDYSLFLGRTGADADGRHDDTPGAVLTCAVSTLATFGLLSLCETPVLHGIGLTVSVGVASAFLLACAFAPRAASRNAC